MTFTCERAYVFTLTMRLTIVGPLLFYLLHRIGKIFKGSERLENTTQMCVCALGNVRLNNCLAFEISVSHLLLNVKTELCRFVVLEIMFEILLCCFYTYNEGDS